MSEHKHKYERKEEDYFTIIKLELSDTELQRVKEFKGFEELKRHLHMYYAIEPNRVMTSSLIEEHGYSPFPCTLVLKIKLFVGVESLEIVRDIETPMYGN